jgi:mannose-6-phosphate isomerase-like protein (cupin superfamily)
MWIMQKKNLSQPDEIRTFEKGKVEIVAVGGFTLARTTLQPGWKWSTCIKPIAGTQSCEAPHLQYIVSGRMVVSTDHGGETELSPGDLAFIPSGHDAWVSGGEPVVAIDITGMRDFAKPNGHRFENRRSKPEIQRAT